MRAFAGESQARNRYTFAAEQCRREREYSRSERHFSVYSRSEPAHARRFYELLKPKQGTTIFIDGSYPVDEPGECSGICCRRRPTMKMKAVDVSGFCENSQKEKVFTRQHLHLCRLQIEAMHRCRFQKLAELLKDHTF